MRVSAVLGVLLAVLFGLSPSFGRGEQVITLSGLPVWDTVPLLRLVEQQPLLPQGIRFAFRPWNAPDQLNALLLSGEVQVASAPSTLLPLLRQRGLPATLLASSAIDGNLKIVARDGAKTLAVPFRGGLPDLILRRLRGDEPEGNIRYTATPAEAMQLMLTGRVDAAFLAEPLASLALSKGQGLSAGGDVCARWSRATGGAGCPVTGVYLAYRLDDGLAPLLESALAEAYARLAEEPAAAAALLSGAFPDLKGLPLNAAFAGLAPNYAGPCERGPLDQTLKELDPLSPVDLSAPIPADAACRE